MKPQRASEIKVHLGKLAGLDSNIGNLSLLPRMCTNYQAFVSDIDASSSVAVLRQSSNRQCFYLFSLGSSASDARGI